MRKSQWGEKQASTNEEQWINAKLATRLWSWRDDTRARWDVLLLVRQPHSRSEQGHEVSKVARSFS